MNAHGGSYANISQYSRTKKEQCEGFDPMRGSKGSNVR